MTSTHRHSWTKLLPKKGLKFDNMMFQLRTVEMGQWITRVTPLRHGVMTWFIDGMNSQA
jgi:hypothetical protein